MSDLINRALKAKRESKYIEFKQGFDPALQGDWCEIIKDVVALANSGGGILVFGLDSYGTPTANDLNAIRKIDPADIANKISKYTGPTQLEVEIHELKKLGHSLLAIVVGAVALPIVFEKPGAYEDVSKRTKTAFNVGTIYFRHGAKSEPGNSNDIRTALERQLEAIRKVWLSGVRKVVQAPAGSQVVTVLPTGRVGNTALSTTVRVVADSNATPVILTRDRSKAVGSLVHEEVSEQIFEEINNVVDANRILAKGNNKFCLGQPIYYRIYAEREHVANNHDNVAILLNSGMCEFYAPFLHWAVLTADKAVAKAIVQLYLQPRSPGIHSLVRLAPLLGSSFCKWLWDGWHRKWKDHPQPPSFYWSFKQIIPKIGTTDPRLLSARINSTTLLEIDGGTAFQAASILDRPELVSSALSSVCMRMFASNDSEARALARRLDYFAYGSEIQRRASAIADATKMLVGTQEAGDPVKAIEKE